MNKLIAFCLLSCVIGLAGCNTMSGFGKDVSKLGDKIEQKADEKK